MTWRDKLDQFVCHRCGNCCKGDGYVWLTEDDIEGLSRHLGLPRRRFMKLYTLLADGEYALTSRPLPDKPCIFYEEGLGCTVHDTKPEQCVDFPRKWTDEHSLSYCKGLQALARRED